MTNHIKKLSLFILFFALKNAWGANSVPQEEDPNFKALSKYVRLRDDAEQLHNALRGLPSYASEGFGEFINSLLVHNRHIWVKDVALLISLVSDIDPDHRHTFSACISSLFKHARGSDDYEKIVSAFKTISPTYWASLIPIAREIMGRRHEWASDVVEEITSYVEEDETTSLATTLSQDLVDNIKSLSGYIRFSSDRVDLIKAVKRAPRGTGACIKRLCEAKDNPHTSMDEIVKLIPLVSAVEVEHQEAFMAAATPLLRHAKFSSDSETILKALIKMPREHLIGFRETAESIGTRRHMWAKAIAENIDTYASSKAAARRSAAARSSAVASDTSRRGAAGAAAAASSAATVESDDFTAHAADSDESYIKRILRGSRLARSSIEDLKELMPLISKLEEEHREAFLAAATPLFKHVAFNRDAIRVIKALLFMPRSHLTEFRNIALGIRAKSWMSVSNIITKIWQYRPAVATSEPPHRSAAGAAASSGTSASASSADETREDTHGVPHRPSQTQINLRLRQFIMEHFGNLIYLGGFVHTQQRDYNEFVLIPVSPSGAPLTEHIIVLQLGDETEDETPDKETAIQNLLNPNLTLRICMTLA